MALVIFCFYPIKKFKVILSNLLSLKIRFIPRPGRVRCRGFRICEGLLSDSSVIVQVQLPVPVLTSVRWCRHLRARGPEQCEVAWSGTFPIAGVFLPHVSL